MRWGSRWNPPSTNPQAEQTEFVTPGLAAPETKGWIGERYDADAGLQYLNARYYDPVLGMFLQPDWWEVLKPGVGTNRFSYSFNDPVNKLDPKGNSALREFFEAVGRALRSFDDAPKPTTINSVGEARDRGIADARRMEIQLIQNNRPGTRRWSDKELETLRQGKFPSGYIGHHITSVSADITKAANHRNIEFLTKPEHDKVHNGRGGTRAPISENRTVDRTLGGRLPDLATEGAKSWPERSARAIDEVLNSRTFSIIDAFDPFSLVERSLRAQDLPYFFESYESYLQRCGILCT